MRRESAVGAMELQEMLYFAPSLERVLANPTRPSLAEQEDRDSKTTAAATGVGVSGSTC